MEAAFDAMLETYRHLLCMRLADGPLACSLRRVQRLVVVLTLLLHLELELLLALKNKSTDFILRR